MNTVPLRLIREETDKKGCANDHLFCPHLSGQVVPFLPGHRQVSIGHRQVSIGHRKPMKGHCINDSFSSGHPSCHSHPLPSNQTKSLLPLRPLLLITITLLLCLIHSSSGLSVGGVWSPRHDFVKVIAKFGFLKSDVHHKDRTDGYVFGNVTIISSSIDQHKFNIHPPVNDPEVISGNPGVISGKSSNDSQSTSRHNHTTTHAVNGTEGRTNSPVVMDSPVSMDSPVGTNSPVVTNSPVSMDSPVAALVLVDRSTFIKMIGSESGGRSPHVTCDQMFTAVRGMVHDASGCDSSTPHRDLVRMIPCPRGLPCSGSKPSPSHRVPGSGITFLVEDQKKPTYEEQDMILYLVMMTLYAVLTTVQLYGVTKQRHRNLLVFLFTISLLIHTLSFFFFTIHKLVFAHDGIGFKTLAVISDILRILSLGLFILFVLIIAKGWPITRPQITAKPLLLIAWILYVVIELVLFVWTKRSLDIIKDIDEYHTVSGWFSLLFRIFLMLWFLCELRNTMMLEQNQMRLRFYLHFGAGIMVWFAHLPIVAIIGLQISVMWRYKLILGFSSAANFLAFSIVTNFMWPSKMSYHFLTHGPVGDDAMGDFTHEELDDYDPSEAFNYYNNPNYTQPNNSDNNRNCPTHDQQRRNNHRLSHPFTDPNHLKA